MRTAVYPGSFNPFHEGHKDIILKALKIFDQIVIARGINPEKKTSKFEMSKDFTNWCQYGKQNAQIVYQEFTGTLKDLVDEVKPDAIVRGLRNGDDLQYEMNQQYWNEDVGIEVPFVYFVTDRKLSHVSSSAIRMVEKLGLKHEY